MILSRSNLVFLIITLKDRIIPNPESFSKYALVNFKFEPDQIEEKNPEISRRNQNLTEVICFKESLFKQKSI